MAQYGTVQYNALHSKEPMAKAEEQAGVSAHTMLPGQGRRGAAKGRGGVGAWLPGVTCAVWTLALGSWTALNYNILHLSTQLQD